MAVVGEIGIWESLLELTKVAQDRGSNPSEWANHISSNLSSMGVTLPSVELADLLVSHICWENNVPITWKFLERAITGNMVNPLLVLAHLSSRVIPNRRCQPAAYRLYMELIKRYSFSFRSQINGLVDQKTMKAIDDILHLSHIFGLQASEPGILVVEFLFSTVWQLLEATLDDEGLLERTPEKKSRWETKPQDMDIDGVDNLNVKKTEHHERLRKTNTMMAVELIGQFLQNKLTSRLLFLARENMQSHWDGFIQRLQLVVVHSSALRSSKAVSPEILQHLSSDTRNVLFWGRKKSILQEVHAVVAPGSLTSSGGQYRRDGCSAIWLPLDLFMEDTNDGSQVAATCAIEVLSSLIRSLQAVNGTTWHDTFLGVWFSAIRHVQRERDPIEGPVPRLDTRLSLLLSITILAIADIIEEEEAKLIRLQQKQ